MKTYYIFLNGELVCKGKQKTVAEYMGCKRTNLFNYAMYGRFREYEVKVGGIDDYDFPMEEPKPQKKRVFKKEKEYEMSSEELLMKYGRTNVKSSNLDALIKKLKSKNIKVDYWKSIWFKENNEYIVEIGGIND